MKKSVSLLASLLLLLPLLTLAAEPRKTLAPKSIDSKVKNLPNSVGTEKGSLLIGGYDKIEDLKAEHVQYLGKFAVHEQNKKTGDSLRYLEVYEGQKQIVDGDNYKLKIKTARGGLAPFNYEASIFESVKGIHLGSFVEIRGH